RRVAPPAAHRRLARGAPALAHDQRFAVAPVAARAGRARLLKRWPDFRSEWVVYEDDDLIMFDKPAGVPSQAAEQSHDDDVVARLKRWLAERAGIAPSEVYLGVH